VDITEDASLHDDLQRYLIRVLANDIKEMLEQAGLSGTALQEGVAQVTFGVATIIDGSRVMAHEGKPVVPVLTFGVVDPDVEEEAITSLITSGEASFMHEYATGVVSELFES
jgi:hypothetical protein